MPMNIKETKKEQHQKNQEYIKKATEKAELQKQNKEVPQELQHVVVPETTPHNQKADGAIFPVLGFGAFILLFAVVIAAFIAKRIKKSRKKSIKVVDTRIDDLVAAFNAGVANANSQNSIQQQNEELLAQSEAVKKSISEKESKSDDLVEQFKK